MGVNKEMYSLNMALQILYKEHLALLGGKVVYSVKEIWARGAAGRVELAMCFYLKRNSVGQT